MGSRGEDVGIQAEDLPTNIHINRLQSLALKLYHFHYLSHPNSLSLPSIWVLYLPSLQ